MKTEEIRFPMEFLTLEGDEIVESMYSMVTEEELMRYGELMDKKIAEDPSWRNRGIDVWRMVKHEEPDTAKQTKSIKSQELANSLQKQVSKKHTLHQYEKAIFDFVVPDFTEVNDAIIDVLKQNFRLYNAALLVEVQGHEQDPNYGYFEYGYIDFSTRCVPYVARCIEAVQGGTQYRLYTFECASYLSIKKHPFNFDEAIEYLITTNNF